MLLANCFMTCNSIANFATFCILHAACLHNCCKQLYCQKACWQMLINLLHILSCMHSPSTDSHVERCTQQLSGSFPALSQIHDLMHNNVMLYRPLSAASAQQTPQQQEPPRASWGRPGAPGTGTMADLLKRPPPAATAPPPEGQLPPSAPSEKQVRHTDTHTPSIFCTV